MKTMAPLGQHNADLITCRRLAAWCGVVAILLGLLGLASWVTGAWTITSLRPQYVPMSPSTALAFLCQGVILWLQAQGRLISRGRGAAMAVAGLVAFWGLLGGVEYFVKIDLNLEGLLTSLGYKLGLVWPTDISPVTGVLFFLAGIGLLLLLKSVFRRGAGQPAVMLGCLVAFSGFTGLSGYLFGTPLLYGGDIIPVAATTSLAFLVLGTGVAVAAGPDFYPLNLFFGPSTRTRLTRIFLPLVLSLILAQAIVHEFFTAVLPMPPALVAALTALAFIIITIVVVERAGTGIGDALDRAEEALRESEQRYRTLVENIDLGISVIDKDYRIVMSNAAQGKLLERPIGDFLERECFREFEKREAVCSHCPGTKAMATGQKHVFELTTARDDGSRFDVRINAFPYRAPDGAITGFIEVVEDITERKQAEEALRLAAHKWQTTFDAIGDAVCLLDRECKVLQGNQAMATLVGRPLPEIIGRQCWEVVHGTAGPIEGCPIGRMRESRVRETMTLPLGDRWFHVMVDPILNESGEVTGAVHIVADITAYQLAIQKIRDLNTLLKAIKDINEALLRVKSESELFQQTCDLLMGVPYVRFAWIGLLDPKSPEIRVAAHAGYEQGYLASMRVTWDDTERGQGPSGEAIRTQTPVVIEDMDTDPRLAPWREEARMRGYHSNVSLPLVHQKEVIGVLNVYSGKPNAFGPEEIEFLVQVAGDIAVGVKSLRLEQGLEETLRKVQKTLNDTVLVLGSTVETRDPYTAGHQQRVAKLASAIAQAMGFSPDYIEGMRVLGYLHDLGKIAVPAEILSRPGKISPHEFNLIKVHPQVGYDITKNIEFPWPVAQGILQHHERLDGSGYPNGLADPDIIKEAKILAVADVVEAMASYRPYRPALGIEKALAEIIKNKGVLYDSEAVDACVKLFQECGFAFD